MALLDLLSVGRTSVPVLCYHNIGGNGVPFDSFRAQMEWLRRSGVRTCSLDEFHDFLTGGELSAPSVLLTFDDGFRDLYTRIGPFLKELGFKALVFIINSRIRPENEPGIEGDIDTNIAHENHVLHGDCSAWLSESEIKELVDTDVIEIGSHSVTHLMGPSGPPTLTDIPSHWGYAPFRQQNFPAVPELAPELAIPLYIQEEGRHETDSQHLNRVRDNLQESRTGLESSFGCPVTSLAWPWGKYSPTAIEAAKLAGFKHIFTLDRGPVARGSNPLSLCRLEVRRQKKLDWFKSRMHIYSRERVSRIYSRTRL